jgi:hypothetical protein
MHNSPSTGSMPSLAHLIFTHNKSNLHSTKSFATYFNEPALQIILMFDLPSPMSFLVEIYSSLRSLVTLHNRSVFMVVVGRGGGVLAPHPTLKQENHLTSLQILTASLHTWSLSHPSKTVARDPLNMTQN